MKFRDLHLIEPDEFLIRQQAAYENGNQIGGLARWTKWTGVDENINKMPMCADRECNISNTTPCVFVFKSSSKVFTAPKLGNPRQDISSGKF